MASGKNQIDGTTQGQTQTAMSNMMPSTGGGGSGKNSGGNPYAGSAADFQTRANRVNQSTPFGSTGFTENPDGTWNQSTGFSGGLGDAFNSYGAQAAKDASSPLGTGDQARDQAINAAYSQATSRLNPQWDQNSAQMEAKLSAQGLDPNSQAYRTAMQNLSQQKNDAYSSAMNAAIGQGTAAQQATFGENLMQKQFGLNQLGTMKGLLAMPGYNSSGDIQEQERQKQQMEAELMQGGASVVKGLATP